MHTHTVFGIHSNVPPFLSLVSVDLNEEIRHNSSNRGIIPFDESVKEGIHKIYPKKHIWKHQLKKGTERRCTDEADSEVLRGSVC